MCLEWRRYHLNMQQVEPVIYLADLGHNQLTISSDVYPLGVANLATYARAHVEGGDRLRIRIFREPQELKAAIDVEAPDILGLSSYSWNHNLGLCFARYAKSKNAQEWHKNLCPILETLVSHGTPERRCICEILLGASCLLVD